MPTIMRLFWIHMATGFGLAAVFVAGLLWLDIANLRYLVLNADGGYLGLAVLWVMNGSLFGACQFGIALVTSQDDGPRRGRPVRADDDGAMRPAFATAKSPKGKLGR